MGQTKKTSGHNPGRDRHTMYCCPGFMRFAGEKHIVVLLTQATACAMLDAEKIVVEQAYMEGFASVILCAARGTEKSAKI